MLSAISLLVSLTVCIAAPTVTEIQLRSLIQPLLDASQDTKIPADAPPLFASLAAVSPLNTLALDTAQQTATNNADQASQISPANQQLAQLNLAGGLTNLLKTAVGSLLPRKETAPAPIPTPAPLPPVDPFFGTGILNTYPNYPNYPNIGQVQPAPAPMPARPNNNNMFNPLSFLFSGFGGGRGSPFGMFMPSLMMRMMEGLMELF